MSPVSSPDEDKTQLPVKVSASLQQVLHKLDLSKKVEQEKQGECLTWCP